MKNWSVPLIVAAVVGIVSAPILIDRTQGIKVRWTLAKIANAADLGDPQAAQELKKFSQKVPNLEKEPDYWSVLLKIAMKQGDAAEVVQVVQQALQHNPENPRPAILAYTYFEENQDFENALHAKLLSYDQQARRHPVALNDIAYTRSLARVDLEAGLLEIDQALQFMPDEPAFRDTRAWLLYQLGRYPEALVDADFAVKTSVRQYKNAQEQIPNRIMEWMSGRPKPSRADGRLTELEAGPVLWSIGVLHFHRAKILEALGRDSQAQQDWDWLTEHQLPLDYDWR